MKPIPVEHVIVDRRPLPDSPSIPCIQEHFSTTLPLSEENINTHHTKHLVWWCPKGKSEQTKTHGGEVGIVACSMIPRHNSLCKVKQFVFGVLVTRKNNPRVGVYP